MYTEYINNFARLLLQQKKLEFFVLLHVTLEASGKAYEQTTALLVL